jgi:Zn-dependent protease
MARLNHDIEPESGRGGSHRPWDLARVFGAGEDPITWWSFPFLKVGGLRLRVHTVLVPVWIGMEVLAWLPQDKLGPIHVFSALGMLLALALLHEVGRGMFARWLGDGGDVVVLWPLGGLNPVARRGATNPVAAESGGLIVNILMVPILAAVALGVQISRQDLLFNPLSINTTINNLGGPGAPAKVLVWWAYFMNLVMLALNAVPMLPMDAGRMMHAWLRRNSAAPAEVGARIGFVASAVLFLFGIVQSHTHVMGIALLGAISTYIEFRRREFMHVVELDDALPEPAHAHPEEELHAPRPAAPAPNVELDGVLEKISKQGMASLTDREREVLARETERRRRT